MSDTIGVETTGEHHELPPPHPELRRLDPLVGNWRGAGGSTDTFGPEMDIEGTELPTNSLLFLMDLSIEPTLAALRQAH